ncbi:hypothetical protein [Actinoplanes sp. NPDC051851]|uniref:WXG100-like domain-containing protein n=1 Tax=Actinoplanes sp. NPDC051851 TaxID=3154753 RepID=UPI00343FCBEA
MTITLPGALTEPLSWVGLEWPEADEDRLYADGRAWIEHGTRMRVHAEEAGQAARRVWMTNEGATAEAFERWWNGVDGPGRHLGDAATASELIGAALVSYAGITLALKTAYLAQLTVLAIEIGQAVATASVTAGATLAEIPVFVVAARVVMRKLLQQSTAMVEKEVAALLRQAAEMLERAGAREVAGQVAVRSRRTAFQGLMREVQYADVRSPVGGAHFYSGKDAFGTPMRQYAEAKVDGVGSVILERTPGGRYFDDLRLYDEGSPVDGAQAGDIWHRLSKRYAHAAEGEVTAWTHRVNPESVWVGAERPSVLSNPAVTNIQVIDPS